MNWISIGKDGSSELIHDEGDFEGAIVTEARVILGGNGLWTNYITQTAKGRRKLAGSGRIAGKYISSINPDQRRTRQEAIEWCEKKFVELTSKIETK